MKPKKTPEGLPFERTSDKHPDFPVIDQLLSEHKAFKPELGLGLINYDDFDELLINAPEPKPELNQEGF